LAKVTLENLTKKFGKVVAVNDVNLQIRDREFFVLVGPNGCGKTTLLGLIAGIIQPDKGNIYIDDVLVNNLSPSERGVRMVFQSYALYPHMKVYDERKHSNLSFALKLRRFMTEKIRSIVSRVAEDVGIQRELFDRKPHELSQGEKQKVAVGRALTITPKVLLMDEPMSNIDPPSRVKMMEKIRQLHEELRITTIYVTQNLNEGMALADRLGVMNEGKIIQVGTPEQILNHPVNEFVADFIKYYDYTSYLRSFRHLS